MDRHDRTAHGGEIGDNVQATRTRSDGPGGHRFRRGRLRVRDGFVRPGLRRVRGCWPAHAGVHRLRCRTRPRPSPGRCTRRMPPSTASTSSTWTTRTTSRQQTAAINSAVAQKVEAIAINPVDEAGYVPATKAAMAGGTVVCLSMVPPADNAVDGSTCSVSVDDILGGQTAAAAIHERIPERRHRRRDRRPGGPRRSEQPPHRLHRGHQGQEHHRPGLPEPIARGTPPRRRPSPRT